MRLRLSQYIAPHVVRGENHPDMQIAALWNRGAEIGASDGEAMRSILFPPRVTSRGKPISRGASLLIYDIYP